MSSFAGTSFTPTSMLPVAAGGMVSDSVFLTTVGDVTAAYNGNWQQALTITSVGDVALSVLFGLTVSLDGVSACSVSHVLGVSTTLMITGISDIQQTPLNVLLNTLSISGVSAVSITGTLVIFASLGVSAVSDITNLRIGGNYSHTVPLGAVSTVSAVGGLHYFAQAPIEGLAAVSALPGFTYDATFGVAGISDLAIAELHFKGLALSVAGVSDIALAHSYVAGAALSVSGVAALALAGNLVMNHAVTLADKGEVFVTTREYYDYSYAMISVASMTIVERRFSPASSGQSAAGSLSVECTGIFRRTATDTLVMTQDAHALKSATSFLDTLLLTDLAVCFVVYTRSFTDTLVMTQVAVGYRECRQTLTIGQTVVAVKSKTIVVRQTLNLVQDMERNIIVGRQMSDTLVFFEGRSRNIGIAGADYSSSSAVATLVPRSCLVILGVPARTIILPCPQFGDSEAYQGQVNLKQTMTGDTFTYVRKGKVEKLQYLFFVGSEKAYEMKQYLLGFSHQVQTLYNWKGEVWKVYITNNPVEFTTAGRWQNKGERVEFTLELEGVKVS